MRPACTALQRNCLLTAQLTCRPLVTGLCARQHCRQEAQACRVKARRVRLAPRSPHPQDADLKRVHAAAAPAPKPPKAPKAAKPTSEGEGGAGPKPRPARVNVTMLDLLSVGVLKPGARVLKTTYKGVSYEADLGPKGTPILLCLTLLYETCF